MTTNFSPFCCPVCQNLLRGQVCTKCTSSYPLLDGLPVLLCEPELALADWRNRWRLERQRLQRDASRAQAGAAKAGDLTRSRLERLAAGYTAQRTAVETVLAPMLANDRGAARETLLGLRTRLPSHHTPTAYNTHIARDWVWGESENVEACQRIESLLGDTKGSLLLPGSGAGRLAFDLGRKRPVMALESNPLLALLSHRLLKGHAANVVEFPLAPLEPEHVAVTHELSAPRLAHETTVVLADVLHPPFAAGSFDAVVTHWLIDVIDCPFSQLVSTINHLLKPGGVWINSGSLAFTAPDLALNFSAAEVIETVERGGYRLEASAEDDVAYLQSPFSRQSRTERIFSFRARKVATTSWKPWVYLPAWLAGDKSSEKEPVPMLPAFATQAASVRIHAWLMGMIDGKRSVADIAAEIARQNLMPPDEATAAVRNFLKVMWEEMQRSG